MYAALASALAAGHTVVTANNRLSRTLRHHYDQQQQRAGASAWPSPDIINWTHWLRRLRDESRLRGGLFRDSVLLDDASAELLWRQCIGAVESQRPAVPVGQFANAARSAWKLVNDWDVLGAPEWTRAGLGPDQQAWLRWSGMYRARCAENRWVDPERLAVLLTADAQAGLFDGLAPVHFAGFDSWPPAGLALKNALQERGIPMAESAPATNAKKPLGRPCADADAEIRAAAFWARGRITERKDAAVAVIVPDLASRAAAVRRVFLDVFAPEWRIEGVPPGLPLNVSYGRPLADLPVIRTALLLLRLASTRVAFRDFSLLLRSTWLQGSVSEHAQRGRLEIELRDQLRFEFALADALPLSRKRAPRFAASLDVLLEGAAQGGQRTLRGWAQLFSEQLQLAGWPGDASVDSETWQAINSWNDLLAAFAASSSVQPRGIDRTTALDWLIALARQRLFQPEGAADGVQVLGVLEAAGLEFDALWVCGMARELWPAPSRPSVFVPLDLQRRIGMPDSTPNRTLEYCARVTQRMLASASSVVVSWPAQQDGEALHPSPLVSWQQQAATPGMPMPENACALWNEMAATGTTELLDEDPPPSVAAEQKVRGGASLFKLQATSPLNAFIEKRLGAFEIESPPIGINARERGNLVHRVLELFYTDCPDRDSVAALTPEQRQAKLAALLRDALDVLPDLHNPFMRKIAEFEFQQQLPRLMQFVEVDLRRPDFRVVAREAKHSARIGSLQVGLKLDRLDELADGRKLVIDYKTGAVNRQWWNPARPGDLQLPLYVTAVIPDAAAVAFAQVAVHGVQYDGVGAGDTGVSGIRAPGTRRMIEVRYQLPRTDTVIASWDELRAAWSALLDDLAQQFAKGDFRLDPRNPDSARGQFAVLSRIFDAGIGIWEDDA